jgi:hypothetical protein
MSKPRELSDTTACAGCRAPGQMHLPLERPVTALPEPRDLRLLVKRTLARDIKESRWSREEIASRIAMLTGKAVSVATLDAMVADSKDNRFPAEWVPAWVAATGSRHILDLLVNEAGFWVADQTERDLAQFARLRIQTTKNSARAEELRRHLWERIS